MEQAYEDRKEEFGAFLKRKRNAIHVSQSVLAQGLCSFGELARIERGERITGKALKDRLLYRLGISPGCYENFLFGADYERWQEQQELLYAVSREKVERAGELLEKYREKYESQSEESPEKRLEQQFILSLEVQLMRIKGPAEGQEPEEWEKELAERFRMALEKTVSVSEGLRGKKYSVQEWNLILEYLHYGRPAGWEERYQEILEEAGDPRFDPVSQAKIYADRKSVV